MTVKDTQADTRLYPAELAATGRGLSRQRIARFQSLLNPAEPLPSVRPLRVALVDANADAHSRLLEAARTFGGAWQLDVYTRLAHALTSIPLAAPDVVVVGVVSPLRISLTWVRCLKVCFPRLRLVIFDEYADPDAILQALMAGAAGYVLKCAPPQELVRALDSVAAGGVFLCSKAQEAIVSHFQRIAVWTDHAGLTPREHEIYFRLLHTYEKDIARELNLGAQTVHTHVKAIYKKLRVHSREDLLRIAAF